MCSYWLFKSEPQTYSIEDLEAQGVCHWEGVRNYQARNFMRDQVKCGDLVLFYHSNSKPSAVVGFARVVKEAYPDFTSWQVDSEYFDPKSTEENPRWFMVDLAFETKFLKPVSLQVIKSRPEFSSMYLRRKGDRLSIQPVEKACFDLICQLGIA